MKVERMQASSDVASSFLRCMAHPERLAVLVRLTQGEAGGGELSKLSKLSLPAFSQQLKALMDSGLVDCRKDSHQVFYELADPRIEPLLKGIYDVFCED